MTSAGATTLTYNNNGNLLGDGTNAYTWDRANRMIGVGGTPLAPFTGAALQGSLMLK